MWFPAIAAMCLFAQPPDPAYGILARAYESLRQRDYEAAADDFRKAIGIAPKRPAIRKDLAYVYLKIGETEAAREQFRAAMLLDPADLHVAKEYAFLCYETKQYREARQVFDWIRQTGDAVAEAAFQNIDQPLVEGIARWKAAIDAAGPSFSSHYELATLAERRDELELAAEHYERAWRLAPQRRNVLVDLGRVWKSLGAVENANAALLAASRGAEPRAAEVARELLPPRYPFVPEFRRALEVDPSNAELRREFAYLLLRMERQSDAEIEFRYIVARDPEDLLSATQLGFLLYARGARTEAMPLFERVLTGKDDDLANRVRAVLRLPQVLRPRAEVNPTESADAKLMAERSVKAGYLKDALKYLQVAHEADPIDFDLMLKLGWAYNVLRDDRQAVRWFDLARKSPDPLIAGEAQRARQNLRGSLARFRSSAWFFPAVSTRWGALFSYSQAKLEMTTSFPIRPYVSLRFIGDTRSNKGGLWPQYYSEASVIGAVGLATPVRRGLAAWFEAGNAASYLGRGMRPDYRGGMSFVRGFGPPLRGEGNGWFLETGIDAVFVSRFGNDCVFYSQSRTGYLATMGAVRAQFLWNGNGTIDSKQEYWANFGETGPGIRVRTSAMPAASFLSLDWVRGAYRLNRLNPGRPNFSDLRAGFWYAFAY